MTNNQPAEIRPRRKIAHLSIVGVSQLHLRNPYVVAFWSAMFPGFGHLLLARYLRAYILIIWEFAVNLLSHVNMALFYTLLGKFDAAENVIDLRWSLLYIPTYLFAVLDSYRSAVGLNRHTALAYQEDAPVEPFIMKAFGLTTLDKCSPFIPSACCLLTPGLGQLMLQRIVNGVFIISFWIAIIYQSKIFPAIYLTCFGQFEAARSALNTQWFLNIPSVYFFCAYATYTAAVEYNKLFDWEQGRFLRKNYQGADFPFPIDSDDESSENMYVMAAFDPSLEVETAVGALEEAGISKKNILASAIDKTRQNGRFFDTIHSYNAKSQFDLPMILGVIFTLLGCIYGFALSGGPVVWGVIGAVLGFGSGLLIKYVRFRKQKNPQYESEVVILVSCDESQTALVKNVMTVNGALGINIIKRGAV